MIVSTTLPMIEMFQPKKNFITTKTTTNINTEMGVLIDAAEIAKGIRDLALDLMAPDNAWRVQAGPKGRLTWASQDETLHRQPARSELQRIGDWLAGLLPIQGYV